MKKTYLIVISFILIISIQPVSSEKTLKVLFSINLPNSNQTQPFIYEDILAYVDDANGNPDIFTFDLITQNITQVTTDSHYQQHPHIQGSKMVWEDYRNGNWDIFLYNIYQKTENQITNNTADQKNPFVFKNYIAWEDDRNGNWDIFVYDIESKEERQITNDSADQVSPQMSQNKMDVELAWIEKGSNGNDNEIFKLKLRTFNVTLDNIKQVTDDEYDQIHIVTSLDNIVFSDNRNGHYNIFIYNYGLEVVDKITSDEVDQKYPAFDLEQIVWIDDRTGHDEIYQFNMIMQEQYQLTNSKAPKSDVQIYYNWIAWVEDRDDDKEIYYLNLKDDMPKKRESEIWYFIAGFILIFLAVFIIIYITKKPKEKSLPSIEEINKISSKEELIRLCKKHGLSPEGNKKRLKRRLVNYIDSKRNINEKV